MVRSFAALSREDDEEINVNEEATIEVPDAIDADAENEEITEAGSDIDESIDEMEKAGEVVEELHEQVEENEEALKQPGDAVTPGTVAEAVEALAVCAAKLGYARADVTSQISHESMGANPRQALMLATEDTKSFIANVVENIKKIFAMIMDKIKALIAKVMVAANRTKSKAESLKKYVATKKEVGELPEAAAKTVKAALPVFAIKNGEKVDTDTVLKIVGEAIDFGGNTKYSAGLVTEVVKTAGEKEALEKALNSSEFSELKTAGDKATGTTVKGAIIRADGKVVKAYSSEGNGSYTVKSAEVDKITVTAVPSAVLVKAIDNIIKGASESKAFSDAMLKDVSSSRDEVLKLAEAAKKTEGADKGKVTKGANFVATACTSISFGRIYGNLATMKAALTMCNALAKGLK